MPSLIPRNALSPQCIACCRRLSFTFLASGAQSPVQSRGKKNAHGPTHINVRLVRDMEGYGAKGTLVPIPVGVMRNVWFPQHIADYIPMLEARQLKRNKIVVERDYQFGTKNKGKGGSRIGPDGQRESVGAEIKRVEMAMVKQPARGVGMGRARDAVKIDLERFEPQEAFDALEQALPPFVNFYRTPITSSTTTTTGDTASNTTQQSLDVTTPSDETTPTSATTTGANIYGSVSTADIATNLKALLANTSLAGKIVLADDDIRFVNHNHNASEDAKQLVLLDTNRVKQLGSYDIEIKIKGHGQHILRQVRVLSDGDVPPEVRELEAHPEVVEEMAGENPIAGGEESGELVDLQARVMELEESVREARMVVEEGGEVPTFGGAGDFGKMEGSESRLGAKNEGVIEEEVLKQELESANMSGGESERVGGGAR